MVKIVPSCPVAMSLLLEHSPLWHLLPKSQSHQLELGTRRREIEGTSSNGASVVFGGYNQQGKVTSPLSKA